MHASYRFDFLATISKQLVQQLETLTVSTLDDNALAVLSAFQATAATNQGVYVLHLSGQPTYLGKADDLEDRLRQHLRKLSGRQNIDLTEVGYKALSLDKSMSTAANEKVLIKLFRRKHPNLWNGKGFGPKDPGKERDTTAPNYFDRTFPIRADFPILSVLETETIETLFRKMKEELPYVFRYELSPSVAPVTINLSDVKRTSQQLLRAALSAMEPGWRAAILAHGMVVYRNKKNYPSGVITIDSPD